MPRSSLPSGYWEIVQDSLADLMRIMLVRCFDAEGHPEVFTPEHIQILEGELTKRLMQILRLPFFTMCQEEFSRCMTQHGFATTASQLEESVLDRLRDDMIQASSESSEAAGNSGMGVTATIRQGMLSSIVIGTC